jgi:hypothetical protein
MMRGLLGADFEPAVVPARAPAAIGRGVTTMTGPWAT